MSIMNPVKRVKTRSRLRTRMALSYVTVTLIIVLILQGIVSGTILFVLTRTPLLGYFTLILADESAQMHSLQAALHSDGSELDPGITFEPGRPASLHPYEEGDPQSLSFLNLFVPYIEPGSNAPGLPIFALVIDPNEQVLASSYPDRYPESMDAAQVLPEDIALIRAALAGEADSRIHNSSHGRLSSVARPIWSRDRQVLGAVYMQVPAGGSSNTNLLTQVAWLTIPSGLVWLFLMLPIGALFGFLTTHSLIRRVERLADATARFTIGDYSQRVPASQPDEIGQLEQQFNQMAEQLVNSIEQQQVMAAQSARAEERARIEQEMQSAYYIQKSLLPESAPSIPGWHIETFYRAAQEVGGDLYDFLALPDGRVGFVIGDANGKGMPSALIMATTCAMFRAAAPNTPSPGQVLAQVNDLLHVHIPPGTFATCFYAILDPASGRLNYSNAGHNLPYLVHEGELSELWSTGMPLGLMPGQDYTEHELTLSQEDCILFYSDGLVEAHGAEREMFGSPRLMRLMQAYSKDAKLIEILLQELENFTGPEWEQEDDITLLLLRSV
jgi:serine phosphatase RsbU (regulator of sigma subunit)